VSKRDPYILTARAGQDARRLGAGLTEDRRGSVLVPIGYRGLRGDQMDYITLTPAEARRTAIELLQAAEMAERLGAERAAP